MTWKIMVGTRSPSGCVTQWRESVDAPTGSHALRAVFQKLRGLPDGSAVSMGTGALPGNPYGEFYDARRVGGQWIATN